MAHTVRDRRSLCFSVVVLALAATALGVRAYAAPVVSGHRGSRPCIILLLDAVTWDDIVSTQAPALHHIVRSGGVGLMNVKTRYANDRASSCLSIGAGEPAVMPAATDGADEGAFNTEEQAAGRAAAMAYAALTGHDPGDHQIVFLGLGRIGNYARSQPSTAVVGKLGSAVSHAGLRVACLGNADSDRARHREGVAIGMDMSGLVALGDVGSTMCEPVASAPAGLATNIRRLLKACQESAAEAELLIVDGGDTVRVQEYADSMAPATAQLARRAALERLDPVVAGLARLVDASGGRLLVIGPVGVQTNGLVHTLTPVILYGPGVDSGLLTSSSTRRTGLIASSDILPAVLSWLHVDPMWPLAGRPIRLEAMAGADAERAATALSRRLVAIEQQRRLSHDPLIIGMIVLLLIGAIALLMGERAPRPFVRAGRWALVGLLAIPLVLLLGGISVGDGTLGLVGAAILWLVWLSLVVPMSRRPVWAITAVTALVIVGDLAFGGRLDSQSMIGHSAFIGARYYGLGNEYGGVLVTCLAVAVCAGDGARVPVSRRALWGCAVVFAAAALICGQSHLGANLGIALSMAIMGAAVCLRLRGSRFDWRAVLWVVGAAVVVAAILVALERLGSRGAESHIGRTAGLVQGHDGATIWNLIARKFATNWRLLQSSIWTSLAVTALAVFAIAGFAHPRAVRSAFEARPWLAPAMVGVGAGSVAAFVCNDSGVVSAALSLAMGASVMAYLALGHQLPRSSRPRGR